MLRSCLSLGFKHGSHLMQRQGQDPLGFPTTPLHLFAFSLPPPAACSSKPHGDRTLHGAYIKSPLVKTDKKNPSQYFLQFHILLLSNSLKGKYFLCNSCKLLFSSPIRLLMTYSEMSHEHENGHRFVNLWSFAFQWSVTPEHAYCHLSPATQARVQSSQTIARGTFSSFL